ncbi:MAG: GNAT family N-acetyltransferase [Clostridia bacterium]|nr:GNAT family N-acetyltransferase [Clostridia bacterium]
MLLEALIKKAIETSALITLEVNEENKPAIHLYEKYGFQTVGTRKRYYDNKFDAYIMTKYFK